MSLRRLSLPVLLTALLPLAAGAQHWYRGNTHTHSLNSDGDSPPDSIARWYRDAGYGFLFITDHEFLTDPAPLNAAYGKPGKFLLIQGQEVTQRIVDSTRREQPTRQAHVTALGLTRVVIPLGTKGLAYGVTVRQEIELRTKREVSIGAVYATLDRLERKGYVNSYRGDPTPQRGGRSKRFFRVTQKGIAAVNRAQHALRRMTAGLDFIRSYS